MLFSFFIYIFASRKFNNLKFMINFNMLKSEDAYGISMSARIPNSIKKSIEDAALHGKKGIRIYMKYNIDMYHYKFKTMIEALEYFGYEIIDRTDSEHIFILINFK